MRNALSLITITLATLAITVVGCAEPANDEVMFKDAEEESGRPGRHGMDEGSDRGAGRGLRDGRGMQEGPGMGERGGPRDGRGMGEGPGMGEGRGPRDGRGRGAGGGDRRGAR